MVKKPGNARDPESLPTPSSGQLRSTLAETPLRAPQPADEPGEGSESAGQSGDAMGLEREERSGPESVEELSEEGQDYEAELVAGVEDAPDADQGGVRAHRYVPPETPWRDKS